jgi:hypothetical protein
MSDLLYKSLDEAMASFEGFGSPGSIATRQHNPGDISCGSFASSHGASGCGSSHIAIFPDETTGWHAMDSLVNQYGETGYSLSDLIYKWSPPNAPGNTPESTANYLSAVTGKLNVPSDIPVSKLKEISNDTSDDAKRKASGGKCGIVTGLPGMPGYVPCKLPDWFPNILRPKSDQQSSKPKSEAPPAFSVGRVAAFLLGLLFVFGALFIFGLESANPLRALAK